MSIAQRHRETFRDKHKKYYAVNREKINKNRTQRYGRMGGFAKVDNGFGYEKWLQGG
jgi:hypothetical protein